MTAAAASILSDLFVPVSGSPWKRAILRGFLLYSFQNLRTERVDLRNILTAYYQDSFPNHDPSDAISRLMDFVEHGNGDFVEHNGNEESSGEGAGVAWTAAERHDMIGYANVGLDSNDDASFNRLYDGSTTMTGSSSGVLSSVSTQGISSLSMQGIYEPHLNALIRQLQQMN
jgi:hypothetical protein